METTKGEYSTSAAVTLLVVLTACAQQTGGMSKPPARVDQVHVESQHIDYDIKSKVEGSEARATVPFPTAAVWQALPRAYSDLGLPVENVEPSHRFLAGAVTVRRSFAGKPLSHFVDCGQGAVGPNANTYTVRIHVQTQADSSDLGETSIRTLVTASAASDGGNTVHCGSRGNLELLIVGRVSESLR